MKASSSSMKNVCRTAVAVTLILASTACFAKPGGGPDVSLDEPIDVVVVEPVEVNVSGPVEVTVSEPVEVTVSGPVEVTVSDPVEVQGYVEVINDALKTPFNKRLASQMPLNNINTLVSLPAIPEGKRLVLEALGVTAHVGSNTKATAFFTTSGVGGVDNSLFVPLPLTSQGAFGLTPREHYMGLHSVRIVIDPRFHSGAQFNVFRSATGDVSEVTCVIIGYLEDIPATP